MSVLKSIEECFELQQAYIKNTRTVVQPFRFTEANKNNLDFNLDVPLINETLIEHVGHLPILATFWHSKIEHRERVDLGRALTMLAIHDIGETKKGDVNSYKKTKEDSDFEFDYAISILPENLKQIFIEFEESETLDAKFARSIDGFAVEFMLLSIPHIAIQRAKEIGFTIDNVIKKKRPLMIWDKVILEVFDQVMKHYQDVYDGKETTIKV